MVRVLHLPPGAPFHQCFVLQRVKGFFTNFKLKKYIIIYYTRLRLFAFYCCFLVYHMFTRHTPPPLGWNFSCEQKKEGGIHTHFPSPIRIPPFARHLFPLTLPRRPPILRPPTVIPTLQSFYQTEYVPNNHATTLEFGCRRILFPNRPVI